MPLHQLALSYMARCSHEYHSDDCSSADGTCFVSLDTSTMWMPTQSPSWQRWKSLCNNLNIYFLEKIVHVSCDLVFFLLRAIFSSGGLFLAAIRSGKSACCCAERLCYPMQCFIYFSQKLLFTTNSFTTSNS
jgi:hypothetical protein